MRDFDNLFYKTYLEDDKWPVYDKDANDDEDSEDQPAKGIDDQQ